MSQADDTSLDVVPACRHAEGTISSSDVADGWRMVSEDSDELVPGFAMIHRLCDLRYLDQTRPGQVSTSVDDLHAPREFLEVVPFRGPQRMLVKERNDRLHKIRAAANEVLAKMFPVVVVTTVHED